MFKNVKKIILSKKLIYFSLDLTEKKITEIGIAFLQIIVADKQSD
jgi:hypothetical protein